ncbi:MAG TPA: PKD domain-containing protein, partial [Candidatus Limnocylindria bacterium]|nr:PKD domain-containing protein [Candidatus Limnocylindria bacterium]
MPSADVRWRAPMPERDFARFRDWTDRYLAADPAAKIELTAEGLEMAKARREDLAGLIRQDPRRAIELAVPVAIRSQLPAEVVAQLEERVDGRGELAVFGATPAPDSGPDFEPVFRTAAINGQRFKAYVYGRREGEPARFDVALHGVAVDNALAVDENPVRVLEPAEAAAAIAQDPVCGISGLASSTYGTAQAVDDGSQILVLCTPAHAEQLNEERIRAESDGGGQASTNGSPKPASTYTEGLKRLLFIRVDFSDLAGAPFTDAAGTNLAKGLGQFYQDQSYGRTGFKLIGDGSKFTPTLRMPKTAKYYGTNDAALLMTDARAAATTAGFPQASFDFDLICFGNVPGYSFAGLGYVGARGCWIRASFDPAGGVPGHELGHNYGLNHANFWDTAGVSATANNGNNVEYGDPFDTMGNATAGKRHFNARSKALLNWLLPAGVRAITTNGTYRVFAVDATNNTGIRALKLARNSKTNYWFEFRQLFTDNRWLMSGLGVRWGRSDNNVQSLLLDTTPGSADGKDDSAVVIGRTFDDPAINLHVTPIGKGGTVPESLDVVVMRGPFPSNQPPAVAVTSSTTIPAVNASVTFTATATDPDGDALAYYWDFGDSTFGDNLATAHKSWAAAGEYLVRCTVTDMKGGTASDSVLVRVG